MRETSLNVLTAACECTCANAVQCNTTLHYTIATLQHIRWLMLLLFFFSSRCLYSNQPCYYFIGEYNFSQWADKFTTRLPLLAPQITRKHKTPVWTVVAPRVREKFMKFLKSSNYRQNAVSPHFQEICSRHKGLFEHICCRCDICVCACVFEMNVGIQYYLPGQ